MASDPMNDDILAEELARLATLHDLGFLTDDELDTATCRFGGPVNAASANDQQLPTTPSDGGVVTGSVKAAASPDSPTTPTTTSDSR